MSAPRVKLQRRGDGPPHWVARLRRAGPRGVEYFDEYAHRAAGGVVYRHGRRHPDEELWWTAWRLTPQDAVELLPQLRREGFEVLGPWCADCGGQGLDANEDYVCADCARRRAQALNEGIAEARVERGLARWSEGER
jgi:hypothetical protein